MLKFIKNLYNNEYAFSILSKIAGVIVGFAYSIVYSRYFGADLRGEAAIITNYLGMLYIFLCMGMYQAYPYYRKGLSGQEVKEYYKAFVNDTFGLFFIYLIVAILLAFTVKVEANYIVVILLLPTSFMIKQLNYIVLIENPKLRNLTDIKFSAFELAFVILLMIVVKANYTICILFIVIKQLVNLIFAITNLKINIFNIKPRLSKNVFKFMNFGFIPMVSTLLMTINYKMDILMLDAFDNVTVGDVGIYSLGVQLAERIWMVPDALKDILLSKLTKGKTEHEVAKVIRISLPIMAMFVVFILLLGQPFITLVYGSQFSGAYNVTVLIMFGTVCMVFYKMIYSYYVVMGLRIRSFLMLAFTAVENIGLNAFLIPKYGMMGAAIASLISYVICGAMFAVTFLHRTKITPFDLLIIKKSDIELIKKKIMK